VITLFWARYSYLNPGIPLLFQELARRPSVTVIDVTRAAPEQIRAAALRSSAIIVDQSIYNAATWASSNNQSVYFIHDLRPREYYVDVLESLLETPVCKLFALYFDLHDTKNRALIDRLRGHVDAVSWMFEKRPMGVSEVPPAYRDSWLTDAFDPIAIWEDVVRSFPVRIELPFALADTEITTHAGLHYWDVCIPGAPYQTRVVARLSMLAEQLSVVPFRPLTRAGEMFARSVGGLLGPERSSLLQIEIAQKTQVALTRSAAVTFVCGGPLSFAVRKFFEIPGLRSAMVAFPFVGFEDLGFVDGVNAVVASPEDSGKVARALLDDRRRRERIVEAAASLVSTRHSVRQRADDLLESVRRLAMGQLKGAQFHRGAFEFC
jgi:hypothetical protein